MNGPDLSRRSFLGATAALVAAGVTGWYLPGGNPQPESEPGPLPPIPEEADKVVMVFGRAIAYSLLEAQLSVVRDFALERARDFEPNVEGWAPIELLDETIYDVRGGGNHRDPLAIWPLVGVKQNWLMQRV